MFLMFAMVIVGPNCWYSPDRLSRPALVQKRRPRQAVTRVHPALAAACASHGQDPKTAANSPIGIPRDRPCLWPYVWVKPPQFRGIGGQTGSIPAESKRGRYTYGAIARKVLSRTRRTVSESRIDGMRLVSTLRRQVRAERPFTSRSARSEARSSGFWKSAQSHGGTRPAPSSRHTSDQRYFGQPDADTSGRPWAVMIARAVASHTDQWIASPRSPTVPASRAIDCVATRVSRSGDIRLLPRKRVNICGHPPLRTAHEDRIQFSGSRQIAQRAWRAFKAGRRFVKSQERTHVRACISPAPQSGEALHGHHKCTSYAEARHCSGIDESANRAGGHGEKLRRLIQRCRGQIIVFHDLSLSVIQSRKGHREKIVHSKFPKHWP